MLKQKPTPFTLTGRFLVAGAVFLFVLLVAAAAVTNTMGLEARDRLTATTELPDTRAMIAVEIEGLLGRSGFAGQLLTYAAGGAEGDIALMATTLNDATDKARIFTEAGREPFARAFGDVIAGRIAQGRLALLTLDAGDRSTASLAMEFSADLTAFDAAYATFRDAEQRFQTREALEVLTLQRWITSLALGAAVFVMGMAALLLHLNVRRPLRKLSENLENLLTDEEEWALPGTDRDDEIGMVARVADDLRRTQLQAGRLLTLGPDGALRLRLEGSGALAVDTALREIATAADDLRGSAQALSESNDGLAGESREAIARIEGTLEDSVTQAAGRIGTLTDAGEEVLRLAGDLEGTRRGLADTEGTWRLEMTELAEAMRNELVRLRGTSEQLSEATATAGARITHTATELTSVTNVWRAEQETLSSSSIRAQEELTERLALLEGQIGTLDQAVGRLRQLADRVGPPVEEAVGKLDRTVSEFSLTGKTAQAATVLLAKEAEAARNARLSVMSEAEADRAHWQTERGELREQAARMITDIGEVALRVEAFANDLNKGGADLPGKLDQLTTHVAGLKSQLGAFEISGGSIAGHLTEQLGAIEGALAEAQSAFIEEANVIRGITTELSDQHISFERERRAVSDQVETLAGTLNNLDAQLASINERVESPVDLSPLLGALRDEMGQAVTHLTRSVEDQSLSSQRSLSNAVYQLGQKIETQSGSFEHLIASGLLDLSDRINSKITAQNDAAGQVAEVLAELQMRLESAPRVPVHGEAEIIPPTDITALIDPRIDRLDDAAKAITTELRSLARTVGERDQMQASDVSKQIQRIEGMQTQLGEAQRGMALALRDGLKGVAARLGSSDVSGLKLQIDEIMETLVRHQDRLSGLVRDMSSDMKTRVDGLSGQITRGGKAPARKSFFGRAEKTEAFSTGIRVSKTPAPEDNELSAIYDALRGLTDELKGISTDEQASEDKPEKSDDTREAG